MCKPKNVMLVHGEKSRINVLKKTIIKKFNIPVFKPANGTCINIPKDDFVKLRIKRDKLQKFYKDNLYKQYLAIKCKVRKRKANEDFLEVSDCENIFSETE